MCAGMGVDLVGTQLWQEEGLLRKEPHHLGTCSFDDELLLPREHHGAEERGYIWGSGGPGVNHRSPLTSWLIVSSMSSRLLVGKMGLLCLPHNNTHQDKSPRAWHTGGSAQPGPSLH